MKGAVQSVGLSPALGHTQFVLMKKTNNSRTCLLAISVVVVVLALAQNGFSTIVEFKTAPVISDVEKEAYDRFWEAIENHDFDSAVESGFKLQSQFSNHDYRELVSDILGLLELDRPKSVEALFSNFLLLERDRLYWQKFDWWPQGFVYGDASKKVESIVSGLEEILKVAPHVSFADVVMLRLARCYSSIGEVGYHDFNKAIDILYDLVKKYPESNLIDDANFEIILVKLDSRATGGEIKISNKEAITQIERFIKEFPKSNRKVEAHYELGIYYGFAHEYLKSANEFHFISEAFPKEKKYTLKSLYELAELYNSKIKNSVKEKEAFLQIIERFPNTVAAKEASKRLENLNR